MTMHAPDVLDTDLHGEGFNLADGDRLSNTFDITLRPVARSGEQKVRVDFEVTAERTYRFSLFRRFQLGLRDVAIHVTADIGENGNLVVSHQLTNKSDFFVSFDCMLFAPNRRRQRRHVLNLGSGRNTQTFILPQGAELIGKTI